MQPLTATNDQALIAANVQRYLSPATTDPYGDTANPAVERDLVCENDQWVGYIAASDQVLFVHKAAVSERHAPPPPPTPAPVPTDALSVALMALVDYLVPVILAAVNEALPNA
jgi:hypothetical protein